MKYVEKFNSEKKKWLEEREKKKENLEEKELE